MHASGAQPQDPAPRWLFPALVVAAAGIVLARYVSVLSWAWPMKLDDAFISFRYARNLVEGAGLVWNPGEPPVEGYSNFLWVLLLAVVHALHLEPLGAAKVIGLCCSVLGLGSAAWLTFRATACRYSALAAAFLLGFSQDWIVNAVLGLETSLYAALMMLALGAVLQLGETRSNRLAAITGVLLALCALTRPEAPMLFLISAGWLAVQWRSDVPRRAALTFAGTFVAIFGPYLAFRLAYYGDFLPNAVRAKEASQVFVQGYLAANPFLGGPEYVADLLRAFAPVVVLAAAAGVLATREVSNRMTLLGLVIVGYFAGVWRTWPVMGLAHRLLLPAAVLLIVLAAPALVAFVRRARTPLAVGLGILVAAVSVRFLSAVDTPPFFDDIHSSGRPFLTRYLEQLDHLHTPLATTLAGFPPISVAITDCGIISYLSRQRTIDLFGLNDRHLATGGPDVDYVLDRKPELIVLMSRAPDHYLGPYDWERDFWTNARFNESYVRYQVRRGNSHHFVLFRRRDWAAPDAPSQAEPGP